MAAGHVEHLGLQLQRIVQVPRHGRADVQGRHQAVPALDGRVSSFRRVQACRPERQGHANRELAEVARFERRIRFQHVRQRACAAGVCLIQDTWSFKDRATLSWTSRCRLAKGAPFHRKTAARSSTTINVGGSKEVDCSKYCLDVALGGNLEVWTAPLTRAIFGRTARSSAAG